MSGLPLNRRTGQMGHFFGDSIIAWKDSTLSAVPSNGIAYFADICYGYIRNQEVISHIIAQQEILEDFLLGNLMLFPYARISSSWERLMNRSQPWRRVADMDSSNAATSTRTP